MTKFVFNVEIETGNDAFYDGVELDPMPEITRITRDAVEHLSTRLLADLAHGETYNLRDYNGNTVGRATMRIKFND